MTAGWTGYKEDVISWIFKGDRYHSLARDVALAVQFAVIFGAMSFAFSLLSLGQFERSPGAHDLNIWVGVDILVHPIGGALAVLPTRRPGLVLAGAAGASLVDMDHFGRLLGMTIPYRASHTIAFLVVATLIIWILAKIGAFRPFRPRVEPLVLAGIATTSVLTHLAVDAFFPNSWAPIFIPFSIRMVRLPQEVGVLLEILAFLIMVMLTQRYLDGATEDELPPLHDTGALRGDPRSGNRRR